MLSNVDGDALTVYCRSWSRWAQAEQFIKKHGETYPVYDTDDRGIKTLRSFRAFPQVAISRELRATLNRYEQEFGLTPSARTRIQVPISARPMDPRKARFFTGGKPEGVERFINFGR